MRICKPHGIHEKNASAVRMGMDGGCMNSVIITVNCAYN